MSENCFDYFGQGDCYRFANDLRQENNCVVESCLKVGRRKPMCTLQERENMFSVEGGCEQKELMLCSFKDEKCTSRCCRVVSKGILGSKWHPRFEAVVKGCP